MTSCLRNIPPRVVTALPKALLSDSDEELIEKHPFTSGQCTFGLPFGNSCDDVMRSCSSNAPLPQCLWANAKSTPLWNYSYNSISANEIYGSTLRLLNHLRDGAVLHLAEWRRSTESRYMCEESEQPSNLLLVIMQQACQCHVKPQEVVHNIWAIWCKEEKCQD